MPRAELDGIKAIVVGAGAIGSVIARELAGAGADVGVTYARRQESAEKLAVEIRAMGRLSATAPCEVTDFKGVEHCLATLAAELGGVDAIVSTVGGPASWKRVGDLDATEWSDYIAIDVNGSFNVMKAALAHLRERGGSIVVLSSIAASLFQSRHAQGSASKAAVEALVRVLAREEGRYNIRVNAVAVGLTESPLTDEAFESWGEDTARRIVASIPLKRIARPEDIAGVVKFLVGPGGSYITGKVIGADGGQYIGH
jgi:NAD(P)-dependent dehydrogenase (short-subunit alcohol dehydrogenase family)